MVKRTVKRKIKTSFSVVFYLMGTIILIISVVYAAKFLIPFLQNSQLQSSNIIKPIADQTSIQDINKKLSDLNIITDSVSDSSMSGTIIAQIKDGPSVYFSKSKDASTQTTSLQLLLSHFTIDNKKVSFIDLRQDRPIVKFSSL